MTTAASMSKQAVVDISYVALHAHGIVNVWHHIYIFPREEGSLSCLTLT
jgi:hypothetical protein